MQNNVDEIQNDLTLMFAGEKIPTGIQEYAAMMKNEKFEQIKEKDYAPRFRTWNAENARYTGRILAVGICYDKNTKEHSCKVEVL